MSRFDRQVTEGGDLPALLGTATEEFRRSLERHVQQIVEAAKGQAAEIERDADRNARQREQQLDLRAQELVKGVVTRASSVLDSIELVQTAISGMLAELRAEVKALETGESGASRNVPSTRPQVLGPDKDQRAAKEPPEKPSQPRIATPEPAASTPVEAQPDREPAPREERKPQPQPATAQHPPSPPATAQQPPSQPATAQQPAQRAQPATAQPQPTAGAQQQRVSEPAREQPSSAAPPAANEEKPGPLIDRAAVETKAQPDRKSDSSAEFDQMIHGEIRRMFHSGKSREDVESFLARFELGDNYLGLLDELYSQKDPTGRRRIFGRRRDR